MLDPLFHSLKQFGWKIWNIQCEVNSIKTKSKTFWILITYLRPISKCALKKSLNGSICCSLLNSTWFAMFCNIFDINMRPLLTKEGTCFPTIPISWGETEKQNWKVLQVRVLKHMTQIQELHKEIGILIIIQ